MAFQRLGLTAMLSVNSTKFVRGFRFAKDSLDGFTRKVTPLTMKMDKVQRAFVKVGQGAKRAGQSIARGASKIGSGMQGLSMASLPLTAGIGFAARSAANFEHQMKAVQSVSGASAEEMKALNAEAQRMGIVSAFSATQSAQGMELMARAGASSSEIISGLSGVMNAAAADQIEMATASDIVAQSVKINRLQWSDATRVADVLAKASASANTDIVGLGEAMKMAGGKANAMGMEYEEIVGVLAKFADTGLKGTLGGTALTNMLMKITKPGRKAKKFFSKFNIALTDNAGKMRKIPDIFNDINKALGGIKNESKRAAMAAEIFGARGERGYNAFAASGKESLDTMIGSLRDAKGAAENMANVRLDNLKGQFTLLMSSFEGLAVKVFGPMMKPMTEAVRTLIENLNGVLEAFTMLRDGRSVEDVERKFGNLAYIAKGLSDFVDTARKRFDQLVKVVATLVNKAKEMFTKDQISSIVEIGTALAMAAAAAGPLMLALLGIAFVIGSLGSVISGVVGAFSGALAPIAIALGVLTAGFLVIRREHETFGETFMRISNNIKDFILGIYYNGIVPFIEGAKSIWVPGVAELSRVWTFAATEIKLLISDIAHMFGAATSGIVIDWRVAGRGVVEAIGSILVIVSFVVEAVVRMARVMIHPFKILIDVIRDVWLGLNDLMAGNFESGFRRIGSAVLNFLLKPIRMAIMAIVSIGELLGATDFVPKHIMTGLKDFANEGVSEWIGPGVKRESKTKIPPSLIESDKRDGVTLNRMQTDFNNKREDEFNKQLGGIKEAITDGMKNQETTVNTEFNMDGEKVGKAVSASGVRTKERSGGKIPMWQRRSILETGAVVI